MSNLLLYIYYMFMRQEDRKSEKEQKIESDNDKYTLQ